MSETIKKICPVTGDEEITIKYFDPHEQVSTMQKTKDGEYKKDTETTKRG